MGTYLDKNELETYMIKDGDNWILCSTHNVIHEKLEEDSDELKTRIDNLADKLGLSIYQKKIPGIPIFTSTNYIKTGNTFVDGISVLDRELRVLEDLNIEVLNQRAISGANAWSITRAEDAAQIIDLTNSDYPSQFKVIDLGSIMWLINQDGDFNIYTGDDNASKWLLSSSVVNKFKLAFTLEKITSCSLILAGNPYLAGTYYDQYTPVGGVTFPNYLKLVRGTLTGTDSISFPSETSSAPSNYVIDRTNSDMNYVRQTYSTYNLAGKILEYLIPTISSNPTYSEDRIYRMVLPEDIVVYEIDITANLQDEDGKVPAEKTIGIYVEGQGVDFNYISSMDMTQITDTKIGMVFSDESGNIYFRSSYDGINWYEDATIPSIIVDASLYPTYNFDYPTLIPIANGGILVCYNNDYTYGTYDEISYSFFRTGESVWTTPLLSEQINVTGIFPKLIKRSNGKIYLFYRTEDSIDMLPLLLTTTRIYSAEL
jgi:hypothetical protein